MHKSIHFAKDPHLRAQLLRMLLLPILLTLASCATTTRQAVTPPAESPNTAAVIVLSRSSFEPGAFRTMRVLSSSEPLSDAAQLPGRVQYCTVKGSIPFEGQVGTSKCDLEVNTSARFPLLEGHATDIDVTSDALWFQGSSSNQYGMRLACISPPSTILFSYSRVPYQKAIVHRTLRKDCTDGVEIGELGTGGELRWVVAAGSLTIAVLSFQSDGVRPWLTLGTFNVLPGQSYRFSWKSGAKLSNRRMMLDGDLVLEQQK